MSAFERFKQELATRRMTLTRESDDFTVDGNIYHFARISSEDASTRVLVQMMCPRRGGGNVVGGFDIWELEETPFSFVTYADDLSERLCSLTAQEVLRRTAEKMWGGSAGC